jgi:hypothetical protein
MGEGFLLLDESWLLNRERSAARRREFSCWTGKVSVAKQRKTSVAGRGEAFVARRGEISIARRGSVPCQNPFNCGRDITR